MYTGRRRAQHVRLSDNLEQVTSMDRDEETRRENKEREERIREKERLREELLEKIRREEERRKKWRGNLYY